MSFEADYTELDVSDNKNTYTYNINCETFSYEYLSFLK